MTKPTPTRASPSTEELLRCWPTDLPMGAILAGDPRGRTEFSLFASPSEIIRLQTLDEVREVIRTRPSCIQPFAPFGTGWLIAIDFGVGYSIEPAAGAPLQHSPAITLARVDAGYVVSNRTGELHTFGSPPALDEHAERVAGCSIGAVSGLERQARYEGGVREIVELIHAGDVFQVNLTHALCAPMTGSSREILARLYRSLRPWHGFYLETPSAGEEDVGAIASLSPELFLELEPDGSVCTRPMKGTRPGTLASRELELAPKDQAELAMIVDLMRNDLGRVAKVGSVRVTEPRAIEPHGGRPGAPALWQGVATVEASLGNGHDLVDLLSATFPPGSITGTPKVRAMQIIDDLEQGLGMTGPLTRRGPYCGTCGYLGDDGSAKLSVAIRTAIFTGKSDGFGNFAHASMHYPVGAGIVADSDPTSEWDETLNKARAFLELAESGGAG